MNNTQFSLWVVDLLIQNNQLEVVALYIYTTQEFINYNVQNYAIQKL